MIITEIYGKNAFFLKTTERTNFIEHVSLTRNIRISGYDMLATTDISGYDPEYQFLAQEWSWGYFCTHCLSFRGHKYESHMFRSR